MLIIRIVATSKDEISIYLIRQFKFREETLDVRFVAPGSVLEEVNHFMELTENLTTIKNL